MSRVTWGDIETTDDLVLSHTLSFCPVPIEEEHSAAFIFLQYLGARALWVRAASVKQIHTHILSHKHRRHTPSLTPSWKVTWPHDHYHFLKLLVKRTFCNTYYSQATDWNALITIELVGLQSVGWLEELWYNLSSKPLS